MPLMSGSFFQASNSPFNQQQAEALNQLLPTLTGEQMVWLSGYLAGLRASFARAVESDSARHAQDKAVSGYVKTVAAAGVEAVPQGAAASIDRDVTIIFDSDRQRQRLAADMKKRLEEKGFAVTVSCMSEFRTNNLKKVKQLLIVVSTYGEGDPPDKAVLFHEFVHGKRAPQLEGTRFSVLSLGDQLYDHFCKTGQDFDARLEELGATRIYPRVDCDVDFDEPAKAWMDGVLEALTGEPSAAATAGKATDASARTGMPARGAGGLSQIRSARRPVRHGSGVADRRRPGLYAARIPLPPRSWRTSISTAAARTRKPATSSWRSKGPGCASSRATRWASTRTTIRGWSMR